MNQSNPTSLNRRGLLKSSLALLAVTLTGCANAIVKTATRPTPEMWDELAKSLTGSLETPTTSRFEILRRTMTWQLKKPKRLPAAIVTAKSVDDVVKVVNFARKTGIKVRPKTGGHGYDSAFLQNNVILLDIGQLNNYTLDKENKTIHLQPAVRSVDLMALLEKEGLSFPAAHCGGLPMGGFLLGGGLGWNGEEWNSMSCFNILEVEVVTADGEVIIANEDQNTDYLWAARGAGPCFFGVVTAFKLKLFDHPRSVLTSSYFWPLKDAPQVSNWASDMAEKLPANVELLFIMGEAPEGVSTSELASSKICLLQATAFATDDNESKKILATLANSVNELSIKPMSVDEYASTPVAALYEWDAQTYPQWRWSVDCMWTDEAPEKVAAAISDDMEAMPSDRSSTLMLFKPRSTPLPADAAFSMIGKTYFATYAIWGSPAKDADNENWVKAVMDSALPFSKGHYINESDYVANPERVNNSFSPEAWSKLRSLIAKYDKDGVFYQVDTK